MTLDPINRRSALRQLGLSSLSLPILSQASNLFAEPAKKGAPKQRLIVMFSPNGTIPDHFWPEKTGDDFEHKTILKPLEPFHDKTFKRDWLSECPDIHRCLNPKHDATPLPPYTCDLGHNKP